MTDETQATHSVRSARIRVLPDGPYQIDGNLPISGVEGHPLDSLTTMFLCRCGGSRNKPFCDATHGLKGFDGTENADNGPRAKRQTTYPLGDGEMTLFDDRSRCAHAGQCSARLPGAFRVGQEPFIKPDEASPTDIELVAKACPSGALSITTAAGVPGFEVSEPASIVAQKDGPLLVRGSVELIGADGRVYETQHTQTLCRCGLSENRPFCDGSHWYAGFKDPLPAELVKQPPSLFEWLGGMPALQRLTERFYEKILAEPDPVLEPIFRGMDPGHPRHVADWLGETFGGPPTYTSKHGGYPKMLAKHRHLNLTETHRQRWVGRMAETADEIGLPDDPDFRSALIAYLEWGTRIAFLNSQTDAQPIQHAPVPQWGWGNTPPLALQAWDNPDAARLGREAFHAEQKGQGS